MELEKQYSVVFMHMDCSIMQSFIRNPAPPLSTTSCVPSLSFSFLITKYSYNCIFLIVCVSVPKMSQTLCSVLNKKSWTKCLELLGHTHMYAHMHRSQHQSLCFRSCWFSEMCTSPKRWYPLFTSMLWLIYLPFTTQLIFIFLDHSVSRDHYVLFIPKAYG